MLEVTASTGRQSTAEISPTEKMLEKFLKYLRQVPVIGFNSSRYDFNVVKPYLVECLHALGGVDFVVKKDQSFMAVQTNSFRFLDMVSYLAPGAVFYFV